MHAWESKANFVVTACSRLLVLIAANKSLSGVKAEREFKEMRTSVLLSFIFISLRQHFKDLYYTHFFRVLFFHFSQPPAKLPRILIHPQNGTGHLALCLHPPVVAKMCCWSSLIFWVVTKKKYIYTVFTSKKSETWLGVLSVMWKRCHCPLWHHNGRIFRDACFCFFLSQHSFITSWTMWSIVYITPIVRHRSIGKICGGNLWERIASRDVSQYFFVPVPN